MKRLALVISGNMLPLLLLTVAHSWCSFPPLLAQSSSGQPGQSHLGRRQHKEDSPGPRLRNRLGQRWLELPASRLRQRSIQRHAHNDSSIHYETNLLANSESGAAPGQGLALDLGDCIRLALERQPTLRAAYHSQAAAQRGYCALENVSRVLSILAADLPCRKQQAQRGLAISAAEIIKQTNDIRADVTFLYYSIIYAQQQEQTASDAIAQIEIYYEVIKNILETTAPKKDLNQTTLFKVEEIINQIKKLRDKARLGKQKALNGLKEVLAVEPEFDLKLADTKLPLMGGSVTQDQVVQLALAHRSELIQAAALVDIFRLEIAAQGKVTRQRVVSTFAAGADIHSKQLPLAERNGEYKPGPIAPEMPQSLVGNREDRVARACEFAHKQYASYQKALNLTRTEAINAFLVWQQTAQAMESAQKRFEKIHKYAENIRIAAAAREDKQELIQVEVLANAAQAEYVEAVYEHIKALITLERVTAGGIIAGFPTR